MLENTLGPGQFLSSVHMEKSYLARRATRWCATGNPSLEVAPGQRGKVDPWAMSCPGIMSTGPKNDFCSTTRLNGCLGCLLVRDCYASLAVLLTQVQ